MEKQGDKARYFANSLCLCCTRPCISSADSCPRILVSLSEVTYSGVWVGFFLYLLRFQIKDVCWYEWIIESSVVLYV